MQNCKQNLINNHNNHFGVIFKEYELNILCKALKTYPTLNGGQCSLVYIFGALAALVTNPSIINPNLELWRKLSTQFIRKPNKFEKDIVIHTVGKISADIEARLKNESFNICFYIDYYSDSYDLAEYCEFKGDEYMFYQNVMLTEWCNGFMDFTLQDKKWFSKCKNSLLFAFINRFLHLPTADYENTSYLLESYGYTYRSAYNDLLETWKTISRHIILHYQNGECERELVFDDTTNAKVYVGPKSILLQV